MDERERLEAELTRAFDKLKGGVTVMEKARGHEATYAAAYQRLVQLGARPQIKKRYR